MAQDEVIIWSENWTGCSAEQQPSEINTMYSQTDNSATKKTKIYNHDLAGGTAPELLVTANGSWTVNISDLKGCYGDVTLSFLSNNTNLSVKANGTKVSLTTSNKQRTGTFSVPQGTTSLTIVFSATSNSRIDNVVLKGTNPNVKTFKFSATAYTAMLGATNNEFPTLSNDYGTSVTYSSSNPAVASVPDKDGTPILKATGTTTITATLDANTSVTASYELTVNSLTNSLSFSADGGTYNKAPQIVTLTAGIEGSKIYYTTNGDEPTTESQLYTDGVSVTKTGTVIKALAVADAVANVTATSEKFIIQPDQAEFSIDSKTFKEPLDVELTLPSTTDPTSKIYYAIGSVPDGESNLYTGTPVRIESETDGDKIILHARVCDEYGNWSKDSYKTYTKTTAVVFDFTAKPNVWGITPTSENTKSNTDGKDLYVEGVKLNTTSGTGTTKTCIYSSSSSSTPNLRVYSGGSLTFTAPLGYNISKIVFTGSASFTTTDGTFSNKTWTDATNGSDKVVILKRSTEKTEIKTASVTLVKVTNAESIFLPASNNGKTYYATFSCSRDVIFTNNVTVNAVKVEDGSLVITPLTTDNYQTLDDTNTELTGYYVPANTGVLISGNNNNNNAKVYYPAANQSVTIDNNQLKPAPINGGMIEAVDGNKYYKLAYYDYTNNTGLGFYWGEKDGGAFKVKSGTAYLEVPVTLSPAKGFAFGGDETGITNIDANSSNSRVIYNLAGQRMSDTVKPGLYIINGKKTVVR
ncbi:MAG: chitobiase/beta-hexosaminidase C-terminal domain-containing protein [Prevotella sp.]|nr:chitobiase/beta-hexosaminidase C-terminal domain-containing protein [Prevotella sp.]